MLAWGVGRLAARANESTNATEAESQTRAMTMMNMKLRLHTSYQEVFRMSGAAACLVAGRTEDNVSQNVAAENAAVGNTAIGRSFRGFGVRRRTERANNGTVSTMRWNK